MYYHTSTVKHTLPLATIFLKLGSTKEMENFLEGILTPTEIVALTQRIEIVKRLKAGTPQRQIASEMGVGIATVSRGAREISLGKFAESWWREISDLGVAQS